MITHPMTDSKPWYQQFWFWFVAAIPLTAVAMGIGLLSVALNNPVELVKDDWSKEGRAINQRFEKQRAAQALGIQAQLDYDPATGRFLLTYKSAEAHSPALLQLELIHPTLGKRDQILSLSPTPQGQYIAATNARLAGAYYVRLYDEAHSWQLDGQIHFDSPIQGYRLQAH